MPKSALVILSAAVLCMALVSHAFAFGEDATNLRKENLNRLVSPFFG